MRIHQNQAYALIEMEIWLTNSKLITYDVNLFLQFLSTVSFKYKEPRYKGLLA